MFTKILIPVDGLQTCEKSFDYAKNLAKKFESSIVLFNAQEISPTIAWVNDPIAYQQIVVDPEKIAKEILQKALQCFEDLDIPVETAYAIGDPAHAIIEYVDNNNCDAIVMSTHSNKALKRFLLGSVTDKVVHHAKVTVVIVR